MDSSTVGTLVSGLTTTVGEVLTTALPYIFGIFGVLVGLAIAIRYVRRFIGGR